MDPFLLIVLLGAVAVLGILLVGVSGFGRPGPGSGQRANRIMRMRIAAQALVVALVLLYVWWRSRGGA
jgi:hypothetical protein